MCRWGKTLRPSASLLDDQIKALVLDNRELLLAETDRVRSSAKDFQKLFLSVRSLQGVAARVRAEVSEPHERLAAKTGELANMYRALDLLRQATHQIKLVQRIKAENSSSTDSLGLSKLARLLAEAGQAWEEATLSGVRVCEENNRLVEGIKVDVRKKAVELLERGVESRNQAEIGGALQALHSLRELGPSLDALVQDMVQRVKRRFMRCLDSKRVSGVGPGSTTEARVWEELGTSMDELRESAVCAWYLQKVLVRKKDPFSFSKLVDTLGEECQGSRPFDAFWAMATERVKECFEAAMVARSRAVRDALVGNYQRLVGLLETTLISIARETMEGRARSVAEDQANAFFGMVASVESEFLQSVQSRLEADALAAFPGGSKSLPSEVEVQAMNSRIHEEMKRAQRGGERVVTLTAAVLGTVLLTIASQARDMGEVVNTGSAAQDRNLALAKRVEDLASSAGILRGKLATGSKAARALDGPVDVLRQTARELLEPIFRSKTDQMKSIVQKMHAVHFGAAEGAESEVAAPSSYIVELEGSLGAFEREVLGRCSRSAMAQSNSVAAALTGAMCSDLVSCWVHHASFVRPLTAPGKLQLAKDAAELESSIQHVCDSADTGPLRAFRKLLFAAEADDVSSLEALHQLHRSVILHHLFSRLPEEIRSPHERSKLSPSQYYVWVEDHTDEEVRKLIRAALGAGGQPAASDPIATLMASLLRSDYTDT